MVIVSIAPYFFKLHSVLFNCKYTVFVIIEFLFHSFIYFLFIYGEIIHILWHGNAFYPDSIELHRILSDIFIAIYELKSYVISSHSHFRFAFTYLFMLFPNLHSLLFIKLYNAMHLRLLFPQCLLRCTDL